MVGVEQDEDREEQKEQLAGDEKRKEDETGSVQRVSELSRDPNGRDEKF